MLDFSDIAKMFEEIEIRLIKSLKRNLSRHKQWEKDEGFRWSAWQAEKLRNIENFRKENRDILGEYTDVIDNQTRRLMEEQFREGEENVLRDRLSSARQSIKAWSGRAEDSWRNQGRDRIRENQWKRTDVMPKPRDENAPHFFGVNEQKMKKLISDMIEIEKTCETAALRMTDDVYRQTLYKVQLAMGAGEMTLEKAIDLSVKEFLDKGLNCIVYSDGRRVNIADYVRMALRTTSTRAKLQGEAKRRAELGIDTVQVSQYGMCSDTCLPWQGQVYIDDVFTPWTGEHDEYQGKSNYCGKWFWLLSYAVKNGLLHPNCRHTLSKYQDGISGPPPVLDEKKIRENAKLEQKQRRLENAVRKANRRVEGFTDPENIRQAKRELREAQRVLREFVGEHEEVLWRDSSREKIYNGEVQKSEINAAKPDKVLDISVKSGIIESERVNGLEQAKKRDHKIYITDTAIDKVKKTPLSDFSEDQIELMRQKHKELLEISRDKNDSNEVLLIDSVDFRSETCVYGDEFAVIPSKSPFAVSIIGNAQPYSLVYMHNHPSTNIFSVADIDTFICERAIKTMSVVTNQGEVYILNKLPEYDYNKTRKLLFDIFTELDIDETKRKEFVSRFLKQCQKGGIEYAKSK